MTPPDTPLPSPPSSLTDWRNVPYGPGTRIYYPYAMGRSCFIAEGVVKSIEFVKEDVNQLLRHYKTQGELQVRMSWDKRHDMLVKHMRVKVVIEVKRRSGRYKSEKSEVAITRLDNITVVGQ